MITLGNNTDLNTVFASRSASMRKIDDVRRRVTNEFPIIYSDTRLEKFNTKKKCKSYLKIADFTSTLIDKFRDYYDVANLSRYYTREILGLKKHKSGNCHEIADATYMAFKINGYEDVKPLWMYAYNPKRNIMRDLDHVVVGINFRTPDGYKYKNGDPVFMSPKHRIYPQKDSVVVDSWAGFCEYGRNLKGQYDRRDLLNGLTEGKNKTSLLKDGEELCFVPVEQEERMPDNIVENFRELFPQLSLSNSKEVPNKEQLDLELEGVGIKSSEIKRLKKKYRLKASGQSPTIIDNIKEKINSILK